MNAGQFKQFCQHIEAEYAEAPDEVRDLFDPSMVEDVFVVKEYAFDAKKLADMLKRKLVEQNIEVQYNSSAKSVKQAAGDKIEIELESGDKLTAQWVFNCTYSQINTLLERSGLERLPLKHEITEMALIEVPPELKKVGVTVMDGPFFSAMPFPARSLHTLSHVRYTPQYSWSDQDEYQDGTEVLARMNQRSNFTYMLKDAQRFIPSMRNARQVDSLFEVKTVLMQNEVDDGQIQPKYAKCILK